MLTSLESFCFSLERIETELSLERLCRKGKAKHKVRRGYQWIALRASGLLLVGLGPSKQSPSISYLVVAHAEVPWHDLIGKGRRVKNSKPIALWQPRDDVSKALLVSLFQNLMQAKGELDLVLGSVHGHFGCGWRRCWRSGGPRRTAVLLGRSGGGIGIGRRCHGEFGIVDVAVVVQ